MYYAKGTVGLAQHAVVSTLFWLYAKFVYLRVVCDSVFTKFNLFLLSMLWNSLVRCVRCCERRGSNARDVNYKWLW